MHKREITNRSDPDDDIKMMTHHHHHSHHQRNPDYINQENESNERPFKDKHHPLLVAIWNIDRFNPKKDDKLKELKFLLNKYEPSILCDILHDVTGKKKK